MNELDNVSDWLDLLRLQCEALYRIGWQFVQTLADGVNQFGRANDAAKAELYTAASEATGLSVKTLQNYVSVANNPVAKIAQEYELSIGYAEAVLGVGPEQADYILSQAKAYALPVSVVRNMAHARQAIPTGGDSNGICPTCGRKL